jgi:LysM repeat protein
MKLTKIFGIVLSLHVGVILLVMFQPGCQTVDKKKPAEPEQKMEENQDGIGSFNEGISEADSNTPVKPAGELLEPTRPIAGELFVPGEPAESDSSDSIIVPGTETDLTNKLNLRPENLNVYKIGKGDTLWGIARKMNMTLKTLLDSNPNLSKDSKLKIGQEIMIPGGEADAAPVSAVATPSIQVPEGSTTYTVRGGDNLSKISNFHGVSLSELLNENGMNMNSIIRPGQVLVIPKGSTFQPVTSVSSGNVPRGSGTHKVSKGENLTRIASKYGMTVKQIMELNNLTDAGKIRIGQSLLISDSFDSPSQSIDTQSTPSETDPASVQDFFKGVIDERPVIDVPE